ncbi:hypothetical protein [Geopseudomonas aromaticivorans]
MRTYDMLTEWLDSELTGPYAREILALAERHGRPQTSSGMPEEMPAYIELPNQDALVDSPDEFWVAVQVESAVRVLHGAIDYHWFPHKNLFIVTRPFVVAPEWATPEHGIVIDPDWLPFQREALKVVQRFMDEMVRSGRILHVGHRLVSLLPEEPAR